VNVKEVLNSIFYVLATGCQWSALPKDLAPKSTAHDYFIMLDRSGALSRIHEALYIAAREQAGKEASPTTAIIDSQSAKAAQKGALKLTRKAMTQAKKSRDASATSSLTRLGCC
jgi:transposase